jgi:hypothetical protein
MIYFGEDAFAGVTQPSFALVAHVAEADPLTGREDAPFTLDTPTDEPNGKHVGVAADLRDLIGEVLATCPRPAKEMFRDPGVHTGNCSKQLILATSSTPRCVPVREGKEIFPFRILPPAKWLDVGFTAGPEEYFRIGSLTTYTSIPIVLRQTAGRPIACLHHHPTYFRNSVLACCGVEDVDHRAVVAWLNSTIIGWYHQEAVREANQKVFPQVKIKHLRQLPMPKWNAALISELCRLHDEYASSTAIELQKQILAAIDEQVGAALGLSAPMIALVRGDSST